MMEEEKKYIGSWVIWGFVLFVFLALGGFVLNSLGLIGKTVVEREVFTRSQQYTEARKTEIATYEASLAEIEKRLLDGNLPAGIRNNLEARARKARRGLWQDPNPTPPWEWRKRK